MGTTPEQAKSRLLRGGRWRPTLLQLWEECHVILLLDRSLCGVCPVRATAELSSPKPVTTMTQSTTTCSHGAEWNLLSYQAGLGLVTDQDRSSSLLPPPFFFVCLFSPGCPETYSVDQTFNSQTSPCLCLCLLSAVMKGKHRHTQLMLFLKACLVGKQVWWAVIVCRVDLSGCGTLPRLK